MIGRLTGRLVHREGGRAILDVRDVGYEVYGTLRDVDRWARAGEAVVVHVMTDVREDAITLYGFSDDADRVVFLRLREVGGVGPKVALSALDALGRDKLATAVEADDVTLLSRIPGVGKKLAQRLALELKGKLPAAAGGAAPTPVAPVVDAPDTLVLALERLGYGRAEIGRAVAAVAAEGLGEAPVADRLRAALRLMSQR